MILRDIGDGKIECRPSICRFRSAVFACQVLNANRYAFLE